MLTVLHGGSRVCTYTPGHGLISGEVVTFTMRGGFITLALALSAWRPSCQQVRGPQDDSPMLELPRRIGCTSRSYLAQARAAVPVTGAVAFCSGETAELTSFYFGPFGFIAVG